MSTVPAPTEAIPFSQQLRDATAVAHQQAEGSTFVGDLTEGRLPLSEHARFVRQLHVVYTALEEEVAASDDPVIAPLLAPELARVAALEADLEVLAGSAWAAIEVLPATVAYADRIHEVGGWGGGLLAHHYVRYLGDLSGGQILGRAIGRVYELPDRVGTSAYFFEEIASPKAFKESYRASLDALPWDARERARVADEANVAFRCNAMLFHELSASRV